MIPRATRTQNPLDHFSRRVYRFDRSGGRTAAARRHIAVALSGGGHRASLFGLGAVLYLVDAGKGAEIACVSSVSGGSITNAYVGLVTDIATCDAKEFRTCVGPLARAVSTKGTVWVAPITYGYLAVGAAVVLTAAALSWWLEGAVPFVTWAVALLLLGWLARQRGHVAASAFDRALFHRAPLSALNSDTDHVICSCDLQTAENVYFSGRFVHSYRLGWGAPGDLPLTRAVQASAALPGAFAPTVLPLKRHKFSPPVAGDRPNRLLLADGGVYDNMATEWPLRLSARVQEGKPPSPPPHAVDQVVVVNASAGLGVTRRRSVTVPLVGEVTSLLAVKDVLYDQTTAVRRRLLDARFRATKAGLADEGIRLDGGMVQIDRSPYELPAKFARGDDDLARRAKAALEVLTPDAEDAWRSEAEANRSVKTTLSKISPERAASLLRHAYVLTMVNMHVLCDYPLLAVPDVADLRTLVT